MKEIKAIIQPHMLTKVIDCLRAVEDLPGVTVSEVRGFGRNRAKGAKDKIVEDYIEYAKKAKLEIVIPDSLAETVINIIAREAHTGGPGDGLIFVSSVEQAVKVRTGERKTDV